MKARQKRGGSVLAPEAARRERPDELSDFADDGLEPGFLHDQGDGVRVLSRARPSFDDAEGSGCECPDEAPPGWGDA